jgi:hypothetical protein
MCDLDQTNRDVRAIEIVMKPDIGWECKANRDSGGVIPNHPQCAGFSQIGIGEVFLLRFSKIINNKSPIDSITAALIHILHLITKNTINIQTLNLPSFVVLHHTSNI